MNHNHQGTEGIGVERFQTLRPMNYTPPRRNSPATGLQTFHKRSRVA